MHILLLLVVILVAVLFAFNTISSSKESISGNEVINSNLNRNNKKENSANDVIVRSFEVVAKPNEIDEINKDLVENVHMENRLLSKEQNIQIIQDRIIRDYINVVGDLSKKDINNFINENDQFSKRVAVYMVCPNCYEVITFYEQNMHGSILNVQEIDSFIKSDQFRDLMSIRDVEFCNDEKNSKILTCVNMKLGIY